MRAEQIRVLLVDDSAGFLELLAGYLSAHREFSVVGSATSGEGAVDQVVRLHPDLVLMDLTMPGMNGLQATSWIKKQPHAPRIIIVTFHDQPGYRAMSSAAGADGYITKDNLTKPLIHMIHTLFDSSGRPQATA
ncbi:MAG: response regulator transcription factor [Acidobacteriia bacterium]|nr:response regulator transcription factor [Terriglobia bacterium]